MDESANINALIIEHNVGMRGNIRNMLAQCGIDDVQTAGTAAAAIRKIQERAFDLILCEYHLGDGQDGQHLLEDLRNHHLIPLSTVFVMVTGESGYERVVSAVELAPNDYLLKPFAADQLHQRIARCLERRNALLPVFDLIEIGNLHEAVIQCDAGGERHPQYLVDFLRLEAQLLIGLGQPGRAQAVYERILATRALPWARLGLAKALFLQRRLDEAERDLTALVAENREYLDAYDWLARTREAAGRPHEAQKALEEAVSLSPHTVRRLKRLGEIALGTGDLDVAARTLAEVVRKGKYSDFRDPEDNVKLIKVYVAAGDQEKAARTLRELDRSMQGMEKTEACSAISSAMVATGAGDREKALDALNRALAATKKGAPLSDSILMELAQTCLENEQQDAAEAVMGDVMRNASDEGALARALEVFERAGMKSVGENLAQQTKQEVADLVKAGAKRAEEGDYQGSVDLMLQATNRMPGNVQVGLNAALALLKLIEHAGWNEAHADKARALISMAREHHPSHPRIAALSDFYQKMLTRYGIQPGRT